MPCYITATASVDFDPKSTQVLINAVYKLGWKIKSHSDGTHTVTTDLGDTVRVSGGKATGPRPEINSLRVAYSNAMADKAQSLSQSMGWSVRKESNGDLTVQKGRQL